MRSGCHGAGIGQGRPGPDGTGAYWGEQMSTRRQAGLEGGDPKAGRGGGSGEELGDAAAGSS